MKIRYAAGACAIIRDSNLDHFVEDYAGPRFFVIGTNHEACKKHAMRKLGRLPPLPPRAQGKEDMQQDQQPEEELEMPCINPGGDHDNEHEIVWTNKMLHGPAVLPRGSGLLDSSSESSSSSQ